MPSGTPGDPNYNPHWDPNWHEPEIPVPGLGQYPDGYVVDHTGDPNYVPPDHVNVEAPVDPKQQRANAEGWQVFQAQIWLNGVLDSTPGEADIPALRATIYAKIVVLLLRRPAPYMQVKVLDTIRQKWVDLDGKDLADQVGGWVGACELQVRCGAFLL